MFEIVKHRVTDAETNDSALRTQCLNLQTLLSSETECETASSDIDGLALFDELKTLHNISIIPEDIDSFLKEDRMNSLALLSIENALASELDYSSLITKFAESS